MARVKDGSRVDIRERESYGVSSAPMLPAPERGQRNDDQSVRQMSTNLHGHEILR